MAEREWSTAAEIEWERYYEWVEQRDLREVFVAALPLLREGEGETEPFAVDLGCGDGKETIALLERGWRVLAIDGASGGIERLRRNVPAEHAQRLTTKIAKFADVGLPPSDFVFAGFSIPFCAPEDFDGLWGRVCSSLRPGGVFAGTFFGPRDTWFGTPDMTFHSSDEVEGLLADLDVHELREEDVDGFAASGPKHWHVFHVVAAAPNTSA